MRLSCLPEDIVYNNIEPYTRQSIPSDLLVDIRHYKESIKKVHTLYNYNILSMIRGDVLDLYTYSILAVVRISWFFIEMDILTFIVRENFVDDFFDRAFLSTNELDYYMRNLRTQSSNVRSMIDHEFSQTKTRVKD